MPDSDFYGTVEDGDIYFSRLYGREDWKEASAADKAAALFEATQHIDQLNFVGDKTDSDQLLQFPRGGDTSVPTNIEYATYEEAIQILSGRDNEEDVQNIKVHQHKFGQVSTTYLPGVSPTENVAAGILSSRAWRLLFPYFRRVEEIQIIRVS